MAIEHIRASVNETWMLRYTINVLSHNGNDVIYRITWLVFVHICSPSDPFCFHVYHGDILARVHWNGVEHSR